MKNNPKILVGISTYKGMEYCSERFLEGVEKLTYPNKEILIIENSEDDEYFNKLKKEKGIVLIKDDTFEKEKIKRVVSSRNKIIDYAIKNDWDYIFMLDADVLAPEDAIEQLLDCNKDIVSGIYFNYFVNEGATEILPVAWKSITEEEFEILKKTRNFPDWVKSCADLRRKLTKQEVDSNSVLEVLIPSAGCMLISRNVFEKVKYGLIDTSKMGNEKTGDDIFFILEAKKLGFKAYCNTKIKCIHMLAKKFGKDDKGNYTHHLFEK
jgi:GT2 family glycosyltransferase